MSVSPPRNWGGPSGAAKILAGFLSGLEQGPLRSCYLNLGNACVQTPFPHIGGGSLHTYAFPKFRKQVRKSTFSL